MQRIVGFFLQKENILQLNNATWEAADQIVFLSLINCFYHDVKGPLFCTKRKICSVHLFHSWPLLWERQQRSQLGCSPSVMQVFQEEIGKTSILHSGCQPAFRRKTLMLPDPDSRRGMSQDLLQNSTSHHQSSFFCYIHLPTVFTLHDLFRWCHAYAISEYKHMHNRKTLVWHYFPFL